MTAIESVRLLINDSAKKKFANDSDITAFLSLVSNSIFLAAAFALESYVATLAASESFTIGSYSERANSNALLKIAESYRARAAEQGLAPDGSALAYDDYVEVASSEFNAVEIMQNVIVRKEL